MKARANVTSETTEKDVSFRKRLLIGCGGAFENSFQNAPMVLAGPIYNISLGVSPVLIGVAMALPRFWEILIDPWIGITSDRVRGAWGKRLPFMIPSAVIAALLFASLWFVPHDLSVLGKGLWLIIGAFLFYTAFSFYAVPYAAITLDESQPGPDRLGLMAIRTAFANLSSIGISWLYWLCQLDWFSTPIEGVRWVGVIFALLIGGLGLLPVIGYIVSRRNRKNDSDRELSKVRRKVFSTLLVRADVWRIILALLSILGSFTLVGHLGFYVLAYHACAGDLKLASFISGLQGTIGPAVAILACPIITFFSRRIGKKNVLLLLLSIGGGSSLATWWLITPDNPYLSIISVIGISLGLAGFWSLMPTFLGDVSDAIASEAGEGDQGTLSAIYGVAVKIGASLALLFTGYILVGCGFDVSMSVKQMEQPLYTMRIFYAIIPGLGICCAILAMKNFKAIRNEVRE